MTRRETMCFKAQARRWRISSSYVRGARIRSAEARAASYSRLYDEVEAAYLPLLKKMIAIEDVLDSRSSSA